jgi:hypothetical protein
MNSLMIFKDLWKSVSFVIQCLLYMVGGFVNFDPRKPKYCCIVQELLYSVLKNKLCFQSLKEERENED